MLFQRLKPIFWAGIDLRDYDSISPIRIVNIIAILISMVLLLQFPLVVLFWEWTGLAVIVLSISHLLLFLLVPMLNYCGHFLLGRGLLMLTFISYISFSSLLWKCNLQFHYFLLIGLFVSPFIYFRWEQKQFVPNSLVYASCFCLLQLFWSFQSNLSFARQAMDNTHAFLLFIAALISTLLVRHNTIRSYQKLAHHRSRLQHVLERTLPASISSKLEQCINDPEKAKTTESEASVLFADIHGYTQLCDHTTLANLVILLDDLFNQFDRITSRYGLEKIKTNGDQYMAVSGVIEDEKEHATCCCLCALALRSSFNQFCLRHRLGLQIRIGVASGPVTSGVIGRDKLAFDIWGSTVNLAARMESQGIADKIQVCQQTYQSAKSTLEFAQRGKIPIKGIGTLPTYWLISDKYVQIKSA